MFQALQALTVIVTAVAMAQALCHALELPGKLRLPKDAYLTTQQIYYPGFTFGGASEPAALLALLVLLAFTPTGTAAFWLTLGALVALAAMHAVYWVVTHPVNNFWLKDVELTGFGSGFFRLDPLRRSGGSGTPDWTALRDQWEYSHVVRAALGLVSLTLLTIAIVV
jgi:Domain of unknown function (DUF1772)